MDKVNEQSTAYVTVTFYDKDGVAAQPTTASYDSIRVEDGVKLRDGVALTPTDGVVEITLTKDDNTLAGTDNRTFEKRRLTVHASYGVSDELHDTYHYQVIALTDVPTS